MDAQPQPDDEGKILKREILTAKQIAMVRSIERSSNIAAWNDYIGLAVTKLVGLTGLIVGGLEYIDPQLLSIVVPRPGLMVGVGLAMLTGKNIVTLIAKLERAQK